MMKTLAVVGAGYLQLPLVLKAREMGLRTICFAWADGAVCRDHADAFYPISIVDKEPILAVCRQERISGIASIASDVAVPTVAYVANALGLVGNSVESTAKSTNKILMREAFRSAGVPCPKFTAVSHVSELPDAIKGLSFPLIVKPTDRSGSMGVERVDSPESLDNAVKNALEASFCRKAVVEECVTDMREISVEGISWKGEYHLLQITDKVTTGAPHYVEIGHHQPALISEDIRKRIVDAVRSGVSSLDIEYGASHAELMITGAGLVFMTEIGARMGGDFIGSDLVRLSTGYDFVRGVIDVAMGQFTPPKIEKSGCSGVWFYTKHTPAALELIAGQIVPEGIVRRELQNRKTPELTRSADRSGYFIYKADRRMDIPVCVKSGHSSIADPDSCGKKSGNGQTYIPFNKPAIIGNELSYIETAVRNEKLSGNGEFTKKCQRFFEERYGFMKCLLTTSGTDALEMAAMLTGVGPGDEVILPSFTFVSTALAFLRQGASLVFADSGADHPNIDASLIEELVTPRTKVIVPVHYAGCACDMDAIVDIAERHGLLVVEDAAQAVDGWYVGRDGTRRPLGSIGHLGCFSFHETKNVIAGEGGMLAVNDERFIRRSEIIWEKGTNRAEFFRGEVNKYGWVDIGSSFLPSELNAAFLYAQLEHLDEIQARRIRHWNLYFEALSSHPSPDFTLPFVPPWTTNNAHCFYLVCHDLETRTRIIAKLKEDGIQAVFHYLPLHSSVFFKHRHDGRKLPNCDRFADTLVRLPLYHELNDDDIRRVCTILRSATVEPMS